MSKSEMTSRDRMLAAMTGAAHDRVPFSPYVGQGAVGVWKDLFLWQDQITRTECLLTYEMDPTIDIWLPDPQPHPDVTICTWRDTSGPEPVATKEYHTPAGVLRQTVRETGDWCSWRHGPWQPTMFGVEKRSGYGVDLFDDWAVSRRTEPWVKGPDDLEKLRYIVRPPEGHELDEWRMDAQRAVEIADRYQVATVARRTIVGDAYQWFCDIPTFLMMLNDDPEFVEAFFSIFQAWSLDLTRLALEAGVDVVQRRGWYETPTMMGIEGFRRFLVPLIEEESALVHQAGKIHSYLLAEGYGAYAEILSGLQADVLQGVDPRMLNGGDLRSLFDHCGSKHAFWGGVNAEVTLASGGPDGIDTAVREAIEGLNVNNRFILSAFLFPDIPQEGIRQMIESWKRYRE